MAALSAPLLVLDQAWRVRDLNAAARRLLDRPAREVLGRPLAALGPAWARLALSQADDAAAPIPLTLEGARAEGERAFKVHLSPLAAPDATRAGWVLLLCPVGAQQREQQRLVAEIEQRETLLREAHHRIKNDLQVVSSLLSLAASGLPESDKAVEALRSSRDRIHSMALVHEQLYRARNAGQLSVPAYVEDLLHHLQQVYSSEARGIRVCADIENADLGLDATITCGLIINELVSNAFRHAFPDGRSGEVRVTLQSADGQYTLEVANDGAELPPDDELERAGTLGLQLVASLVHQLGGRLEILRDGGTLFRITFARPQQQD